MTNTDAQDELDQINTCLESVSDLLIPENDMNVVNRDKFSILMNYLLQRQAQAFSALNAKAEPTPPSVKQQLKTLQEVVAKLEMQNLIVTETI